MTTPSTMADFTGGAVADFLSSINRPAPRYSLYLWCGEALIERRVGDVVNIPERLPVTWSIRCKLEIR